MNLGEGACSLWFDHLGPFAWGQCCFAHDLAYAALVDKAVADAALGRCVDAVLPGMGFVMWAGVTLFGGLWYVLAVKRYFAGQVERCQSLSRK